MEARPVIHRFYIDLMNCENGQKNVSGYEKMILYFNRLVFGKICVQNWDFLVQGRNKSTKKLSGNLGYFFARAHEGPWAIPVGDLDPPSLISEINDPNRERLNLKSDQSQG